MSDKLAIQLARGDYFPPYRGGNAKTGDISPPNRRGQGGKSGVISPPNRRGQGGKSGAISPPIGGEIEKILGFETANVWISYRILHLRSENLKNFRLRRCMYLETT